MSFEEPLPGGVANAGAVVRVGDTVRRPVAAHTPGVHALLSHLEHRGFDGAPRVLGHDERGREVLTYVPGDVAAHFDPPPWVLTDEALVSVVALVRRFHDAVRGFVPPADALWSWPPPPAYQGDLIGHNDVCRENVVFRDGRAVALIDFDYAAPVTPAWDVASVARHWVLALPGDRRARFALVRETYPVDGLKQALLDRLDWGIAMVRARAEAGDGAFARMWASGAYDRNRALRAWAADHLDD